MAIVIRVLSSERRALERIARKSLHAPMTRRALVMLQVARRRSAEAIAESFCIARSTVYAWVTRYEEGGIDALMDERRGRARRTLVAPVIEALEGLLACDPQSLGYLRSRWSSELLAKEVSERTGVSIHASTVRRALGALDWVWRRARPTLHIADPRKAERMRAIRSALALREPGVEVFYQDEADVDLNPRIGSSWRKRGAPQTAIPTPGKNAKAYVAGALHVHSGKVVWVGGLRKNAALFIENLRALVRAYPKARRLLLILDNYGVHKCRAVQAWLARHPKVELLFQPAYHPWVNRIERLWKAMHDTVTRNHKCRTLEKLCSHVARFIEVAQPFPGAGQACATLIP